MEIKMVKEVKINLWELYNFIDEECIFYNKDIISLLNMGKVGEEEVNKIMEKVGEEVGNYIKNYFK